MNVFKKVCLTGAAICALALGAAATQTANAATLNWTSVNAWQGATPGQTATSVNQQALPSATGAPLALTLTSFAGGPINFNLPAAGTNSIVGFFATAGTNITADCTGACASNVLSTGGYAFATIMEFTFTDTLPEVFSVNHDDGVSLFDITTASGNLLPTSASAPTTLRTDSLIIQPGTYQLWYAEVNGLPATLQATSTVVPLPAALPLFASGLLGLGLLGCRRKKKAVA